MFTLPPHDDAFWHQNKTLVENWCLLNCPTGSAVQCTFWVKSPNICRLFNWEASHAFTMCFSTPVLRTPIIACTVLWSFTNKPNLPHKHVSVICLCVKGPCISILIVYCTVLTIYRVYHDSIHLNYYLISTTTYLDLFGDLVNTALCESVNRISMVIQCT